MPKPTGLRSPNRKAKPRTALAPVVRQTERLWRRAHLTYDQAVQVAKKARARLGLARPSQRVTIVDRLTREEERRLVTAAYRVPGARGLLVKTLLFSGLRVAEFVALRVGDFLFEEGLLRVRRGKGDKGRVVPILPELAQELRTHLDGREVGFLFETRSAGGFTARRVQQIVKEAAIAAGITKRVYPHLLRHTVAQQLLEGGMPLDQVQAFLGHAKIETTQVYARSTAAMVRDSYHRVLGRPGAERA